MTSDELPTTPRPIRRLRRFVELLVVTAVALTGSLVTSAAPSPPAAADVVICDLLTGANCGDTGPAFPPPPMMYLETSGYGGNAAQNASLRVFEQVAVETVLDRHGLPASEENAVRSWGRDEVLAHLYILLVDALQTPAAQRTTDQQNVADWAAEQARRRNAESAHEAAREYAKWAGLGRLAFDSLMSTNPSETQIRDFLSGPVATFDAPSGATEGWCVYRSPTPYGSEYQGFNNPVCSGPFIGFVFPPTPSYDQFVKWGAAKANYLLFSNGSYTERANRLGAALGVSVPFSAVVTAAATYSAAARIAVNTARLAASSQLMFRITGTLIQATSFSAAVVSLIAASAALGLTIIAAIVTAILVGIDVTNAANLPGKLASLVATARSTVPDPATLVDSTDTATSFASIFVAATAPVPTLTECDPRTAFPGFLELTIIGTDETRLSPNAPCLNATRIPAAADTDPIWALTDRQTGAKTAVPTLSFRGPSGPTTARFNQTWFVTGTGTAATQSLRMAYQDWNNETQNAWIMADATDYWFLTFKPPADSSETVDIDTCVADGNCGVSQSLQVIGADGKQYTASIRRYQAATGTPTASNVVQTSPVAFDANGFAPGGAVSPISYSWTVRTGSCFFFTCPTVATLTGASPTFTFDQAGPYEAEVTATDATGVSATTTFRFTVAAVPPSFTLLPNCTGAAGPSCNTFTTSPGAGAAVRGTIRYAGAADKLKVTVDWGDGTGDAVDVFSDGFRFPSGSPITATKVAGQLAYTLTALHTYSQPGTYRGSVKVANIVGLATDGPSVTVPFTMTVVGPQAITFTAPGGSSYGSVFGISATGGASGRPVTFAASGSCTLSNQTGGVATGSATVTVISAGTCTITARQAGDANFPPAPDVVQRIPTLLAPLQVTASSPTIRYGQPIPAITPSYDGFKFNDTAAVLTTAPTCTVTSPGSAAGSSATTCSGAAGPNYSFTYVPGTLTIERAPLTVVAPDATMVQGGGVPAFVPSFRGLTGTDGPSAVSGVTCGARDPQNQPVSSSTPAGSYPINCSGGTAANYSLSYEAGTLTVSEATSPPTTTTLPPSSTASPTTTTLPSSSTASPTTSTSVASSSSTTVAAATLPVSCSMTAVGVAERCVAPAAMNGASALSWSAWVKLDSTAGTQTFVSRAASPWADQSIRIGAFSGWLFAEVTTSSGSVQLLAGGTIPVGVWTHLAATYDGATLRFYVNGVAVGSRAASGVLRADLVDAPIVAGGAITSPGGAPGRIAQGLVAPAVVTAGALDASAIAAQHAAGPPAGSSGSSPSTTTVAATTTAVAATTTTTVPAATTTVSGGSVPAPTTTSLPSSSSVPGPSGAVVTASSTTPGSSRSVPSPAALNTARQLTASVWVKLDDTTGHQAFVSRAASPWGDQTFIVGAFSGWLYTTVTTTTGGAQVFSGGTIRPGVWTHVAMTYDGSTVSIYVNGVLASSKPATGLPRLDRVATPVMVGGRANGTAAPAAPDALTKGVVDPARVYDRALNATEVAAEYRAGR